MRTAVLLSLLAVPLFARPAIRAVAISRASFNPSIAQSVSLSFETTEEGKVSVAVVDRDGYVVRTLARDVAAAAGPRTVVWNGRDDRGEVVPDEAWSFRIELTNARGRAIYFPADIVADPTAADTRVTYDRDRRIVSYTLNVPARVHLQAGSAGAAAGSRSPEGPVLRTVVNREPRVAGRIVEQWNGLDESGTIYVPDLPNFVMAVAAVPLPENSVITTGNRRRTFLASTSARAGASLFQARAATHAHHRGLSAAEDVAPPLAIEVNGTGASSHVWRVADETLRVTARLDGPTAAAFAAQGGRVQLYVDGKRVEEVPVDRTSARFAVSAASLTAGPHIVAVNWVTPNGPVAVNAARVERVAAR